MITLKEAQKKFVKNLEKAGRTISTRTAYSKDIEQLVEYLDTKKAKKLATEIRLSDLNDFMKSLADEGYQSKTISRKTNATRTFFRFLKSENFVEADPAQNLEHPKLKVKSPRILSKVEYRALRDAARKDKRTAAIVELLLQTGIRIGELARLRISDVKLNKGKGEIFITEYGSHMARTVPLNEAAENALRDYLETRGSNAKSDYLFITKTGKPLLVRNIRATLNRYFKQAGLEDVKVNDLRHTFIAHHLKQGTSLISLSKIAGHKRLSTTEKYLQYVETPQGEQKVALEEL